MLEGGFVLALVGLSVLLYLLPWALAAAGGHPKRNAILVLNLLLGWTLLGWVAALVWAFTDRAPAATCSACRMAIDPAATICPHCRTSQGAGAPP